jgi:hypothetical protein
MSEATTDHSQYTFVKLCNGQRNADFRINPWIHKWAG